LRCISSHFPCTTASLSPSLESTTSAAFDALWVFVRRCAAMRGRTMAYSPPLCPLVQRKPQPERE
jgi:hypothetical protein